MAETVEQAKGTVTENSQETRTFTQEDVNAIVQQRLVQERAKYSDYETLKEKAQKYDEAEEESKSDLQKATERADELQKQIDLLNHEKEIRGIREKVSQETGVPASLLVAETEDACRELANGILEYNSSVKRPVAPRVKDGGEVKFSHAKTAQEEFAEWFEQATQ